MDDDVEISALTSEDEQYGDSGYASFRAEFEEKVSINTIMSGATSIGRNEARLMLCQLRGVSLQKVAMNDPGVLMLDGVAVSELGSFLENAQGPIVDALRGGADDSSDDDQGTLQVSDANAARSGSVSANNEEEKGDASRTTLPELAQILANFRSAETVNKRSQYRKEFFTCFNQLDAVHRLQIPTNVRSLIESAQTLGASNQETLLMEVNLPENIVQRMSVGEDGGTGYGANWTPGMETTGGTTSLYGETGLMATSGVLASTIAQKVAEMESKNVLEWIKNNKSSSHVWFFFVGILNFILFFIQIWVDYAYGEMWRAVLMELLCLVGVLICIMEADTPFIRTHIQTRLYRYYQFLSGIKGRTTFYAFVCFLAFGSFTDYDLMAVVGGSALLIMTVIRYWLFEYSDRRIENVVYPMIDSSSARDKFDEHDVDHDGYLRVADMEPMVGTIPVFTRWLHEVIFWRMDSATNDGQIDVHEFVQFCLQYKKDIEKRNKMKLAREARTSIQQQLDKDMEQQQLAVR